MIRSFRSILRRFKRNEDGAAPVLEFVIMFPLFFFFLLSGFELGIHSFRQHWLDRGLDLAVRDIRLNTGANYNHNQVKDLICDYSGFLENCDTFLRLEMNPVDPRAFAQFGGTADCVDTAQPLAPLRSFVNGANHQLMIMRACYLYDPLFPSIGLGDAMLADGEQYYPLISVSVFVQEPT